MSSLFDIGKSAIQSYRQALAVTGQNIANVNTDGYKRREADLKEVGASSGSVTSTGNTAGLGVRVEDIRRSFDQFLLDRTRSSIANFEKLKAYTDQMKQLEDTLLPGDADIGSYIGRFFGALQDIAANPGDLAPRTVALEQGKSLAGAFRNLSVQLSDMQKNGKSQAEDTCTAINTIVSQLVGVNERLLSSSLGSSPNSTLDLRDRLLEELSKLTDISVSYNNRKDVTVTIGKTGAGPKILDAKIASKIGIADTGGVIQVLMGAGTSNTPTNQVSGGILGGMVDSFALIGDTNRDIDNLAVLISEALNEQHRQGLTLDGKQGENIFVTSGMTVASGRANRSNVSGEIIISDIEKLPKGNLTAKFNAAERRWTLSGTSLENDIFGTDIIKGPGFTMNILGAPSDGDELSTSPLTGAASGMQFMLRRAQDFAAASKTLVSATVSNKGTADISATSAKLSSNDTPPALNKVFTDSNSPLTATNFLGDGAVAAIPAGSPEADILSFKTQSQMSFQLTATEIPTTTSLSLEVNSAQHIFDLTYSSVYPKAGASEKWKSCEEIASALNRGTIKNGNLQTLTDLGLFASGSGGSITFASADNDFSGQSTMISGGGTILGVKKASSLPSNVQIFTREGRHLAGTPLTKEDIAKLVSTDNGFNTGSSYRADYLNLTGADSYRGLSIERNTASGEHIITLGTNSNSVTTNTSGIASSIGATITSSTNHGFTVGDTVQYFANSTALNGLIDKAVYKVASISGTTQFTLTKTDGSTVTYGGGNGHANDTFKLYNINSSGVIPSKTIFPDSPVSAYNASISMFGGESGNIDIPAGSSAGFTARKINTDLANLGVQAEALTRVELSMAEIGSISYGATRVNQGSGSPAISISSTYTTGAATGETEFKVGDIVKYSAKDGHGVHGGPLQGLTEFAEYQVATVSANSLTLSNTDGTTLTYGNTGGNASGDAFHHDSFTLVRRTGQITMDFESKNQDAININATISSDDMTDLAKKINEHTANTGVAAYLSVDKKKIVLESKDGDDIMMSNFSSSSPPMNIKSLGDDFQTLGTEVKLDNTTFDAARFTGFVQLNSGGSFSMTTTAGSNSSTISSATDVFENGFIEKTMTPTGEQMTLRFDAFEGADGNGSSVDGSLALSAGGEYKLTIPNTGTGTSFSSMVNTKDLESITSSTVASEIAKKLRSDSIIASVSGKSSVAKLPDAGDKLVVKFAEQNYTLTMLNNGRDAVPATTTFTVSSADAVAVAGNRIHLILSAGMETEIELDYTVQAGQTNISSIVSGLNTALNNAGASEKYIFSYRGTNLTLSRKDGVNFQPYKGTNHTTNILFYDGVDIRTGAGRESINGSTPNKILISTDGKLSVEREIEITGGEKGRLDAHFDENNKLQIYAGGSLSGQQITIPDDNSVSGNSNAATRFGIDQAIGKLSGNEISVPASTSTTNVKVGDIDYTLTVNPNNGGKVTVELKDGNDIVPTNILLDATVNWMSDVITSDTSSVVSSQSATITTDSEHDFNVGDKIKYFKGGTALNGLTHNTEYTVASIIKKSSSAASTTGLLRASSSTITSTNAHEFKAGDFVKYFKGGTNDLQSLTSGTVYKIKEVIGTNQFKLQTASGGDFTYGGTGGSTADAFIRYDGFSLKSASGATISYGGGNGHAADIFVKTENTKAANTAGQTNNTSATITVGEGHGFKAGDTVRYIPAGTAVQGLFANTDYKVKALVGTTGISLQTTGGADFAYLGTNGSVNDVFVKANGRITISTDPYSKKTYKFDQNSGAEALGIKVSDYRVNVDNDNLVIASTEGKIVSADTSGTNTSVKSLIGSNISIKNVGNEDLIMIVNGGGARSIATRSDPPDPNYELKASNIEIKVANTEGSVIEFLDATTGHSIATRTLDTVGRAEAAGYKVVVKGKGQLNDTFKISDNAGGTGDARNLDAMIMLQSRDASGPNSGGFREVFDNVVTSVGASVLSGDLSLEAAEATKEAAMASELEFSGVSLDTEAAQLLEQQQAFQASARILSTARELFRTLLDVV